MLDKKNSMGRDIYQTVFILLNFLQTGGNNRRFFSMYVWIKEKRPLCARIVYCVKCLSAD